MMPTSGPNDELDKAHRELQDMYAQLDWPAINTAVSRALETGFRIGQSSANNPSVNGTPVWVYSPHVEGVLPAHQLFSGYLIPGAPWMFWNRVVPDGHYLDLPPMYRIEQREERS